MEKMLNAWLKNFFTKECPSSRKTANLRFSKYAFYILIYLNSDSNNIENGS